MSGRAWTNDQLRDLLPIVEKLSFRMREQLARFHDGSPRYSMNRRTAAALIKRGLIICEASRIDRRIRMTAEGNEITDYGDGRLWVHEYWIAGSRAYNAAVWLYETPKEMWP